MNEWGDDFERKHFDGDIKSALRKAPTETWKGMNEWGDDFERRNFNGDLVGTLAQPLAAAGQGIRSKLGALEETLEARADIITYDEGIMEYHASAAAASTSAASSAAPSASSSSRPSAPHVTATTAAKAAPRPEREPDWRDAQRLQETLPTERERRKGRVAASRAMDEALRLLRAEAASERRCCLAEEARLAVADATSYIAERDLTQLQEKHHALLSCKAKQEAEVQRHALARAHAERKMAEDEAIREFEGPRAWAKAGKELEALKDAKLELANVLMLVDEARLEKRRELRKLQDEVEKADAEGQKLREVLKHASDGYVAPGGSIKSSLRRLWAVASGKGDPYDEP